MKSPSTNELEPTWERVLSIWWLLFWRWGLVGFSMSFVVGFIWGLVVRVMAISPDYAFYGGAVIGFVVAVIWGVVATRMALRKAYSRRGFRLALVPHPSN